LFQKTSLPSLDDQKKQMIAMQKSRGMIE